MNERIQTLEQAALILKTAKIAALKSGNEIGWAFADRAYRRVQDELAAIIGEK